MINEKKKGLFSNPRLIVEWGRSLIYILFGVFIFFMPDILVDYPTLKYIFCAGSVLYGLIRMRRVYITYYLNDEA